MKKNQIIILENRGLVLVQDVEAKEFLQNIISNNIDKVNKFNSIFSAILTPQGKYLYEFFIIKSEGGYLLDCHIEIKDDLIKHLSKYKLRSKIEIRDLSSSHAVGIISKDKFNFFIVKWRFSRLDKILAPREDERLSIKHGLFLYNIVFSFEFNSV